MTRNRFFVVHGNWGILKQKNLFICGEKLQRFPKWDRCGMVCLIPYPVSAFMGKVFASARLKIIEGAFIE